jgi:membrane-bound lytic murein transglycosylase MltF
MDGVKNRNWGAAAIETKEEVAAILCNQTEQLSAEDRETALAIAYFESGFNPEAKAQTTSASGIFQIVRDTARKLGLRDSDVFDAKKNIQAGIKLFMQNLALAAKKFPKLKGDQKAAMLYALHHDGPSLQYGGYQLANDRFLPILEKVKKAELCA